MENEEDLYQTNKLTIELDREQSQNIDKIIHSFTFSIIISKSWADRRTLLNVI